MFVTPEGLTTMVANEGLEKARAYLNRSYKTNSLMSPLKDMKVHVTLLLNFGPGLSGPLVRRLRTRVLARQH